MDKRFPSLEVLDKTCKLCGNDLWFRVDAGDNGEVLFNMTIAATDSGRVRYTCTHCGFSWEDVNLDA